MIADKGGGVEDDPVVLERAARGNEASRHVLAQPLGIAGEGIALAPAAAGLEAEEVAPLEGEALAEGGQLPLPGSAAVEEEAPGPPGAAAGHPVGSDER